MPDTTFNPSNPNPAGRIAPGNIDLTKLPVINNSDGSYSTLYSTSFTDEHQGSPTYGKDVLVRGILNGKRTDDVDALKRQYYKTGEHLGVFRQGTPQEYKTQTDPASLYGTQLHEDWQAGRIPGVQMGPGYIPPGPPPQPQMQNIGILQLLQHILGH